MPITTAEIAAKLGGTVMGDVGLVLHGFAPADRAQATDLTFAENEEFFTRAEGSAAGAILVSGKFTSAKKTLIKVPNARIAFAKVLPEFFPEPQFAPGIHPMSVIAPSAKVDATAHIGAFCVVGENVTIGARAVLQGGNHIGAESQIGEDSNLFPNVTLYRQSIIGKRVRIHSSTVIGGDGFGYVLDAGQHRKVPQVGNVVIGDDVEIGAGVMIDRGALGSTTIGKGSKIDNLVQIGHNVVLGECCLLVSQVGIAGSTKLGNYVVLGGQVGIAGHLTIGNKVTIGAKSGVMFDAKDGEKLLGQPAIPDRTFKRQFVALQHLPDLLKKVKEWEKKLGVTDEDGTGQNGES